MVLLPIIVSVGISATLFIVLYKIPPGWVSQQATEIAASLQEITNPTNLGDAIHHALTKNDAEVLGIVGEEANGIVHEAIPLATEKLANEAVGLIASMYSKGVASEMGKRSGAARGYLQLPGIQKTALKTGAESLLGGGLGELLGGMDISPEMIQMFMSSMAGGSNNGPGPKTNTGQPPLQSNNGNLGVIR
jgi:hypothetical protein